jgi:hypothetical protein
MQKSEEQDYNEWKNKSDSKFSGLSGKFKPVHLIGIVGAFFVFYYFYTIGKINNYTMLGGVVLVGGIILLMAFKPNGEKKLLPEHVIKRIVLEAVLRKKLAGIEVPHDAKIETALEVKSVRESDFTNNSTGIVSRQVGLKIIQKGYIKKYIVFVEPYNGTILDFREAKLGFIHDYFSKDKKVYPVSVVNAPDMSRPENRGL